MTVPTAGTYDGLYVYPVDQPSSLGTTVDTLLTGIDDLLGSNVLTSLVLFGQPLASDAAVTFSGNNLSFVATDGTLVTLSDGTATSSSISAQGSSVFEFSSGGVDYIVSNGALTGAVSLDDTLSALATANPGLVATLVDTLKTTIDGLGAGGLLVVPSGDFNNTPYSPPCFVAGTLIATPAGEIAVEDLRVGGLVSLAGGGQAEITWTGHRRVTGTADLPVRIRAGALGPQTPRRDLLVSPDHALFLDGVLVPAALLVNGRTIVRDQRSQTVYHHVEIDGHDILLAEGAPAESYIDTGNRAQFANCSLTYDPILAARHDPCAEVVFAGQRLDAIRASLRSRQPA